jgi:hypothetical protein
MKKVLLVSLLLFGLAVADEGENAIQVGPLVAFGMSDVFEGTGFGANVALNMGFSEQTDMVFHFNGAQFRKSADKSYFTSVLFGSYFTPHFGDIRPRFGGVLGGNYIKSELVDELQFTAGGDFQILFDRASGFDFLIGMQPLISFGSEGSLIIQTYFSLYFDISE